MDLVKRLILCFVLVIGVSAHVVAVEKIQLEEYLSEAQKYQNVKPVRSLKILEQHKAHIQQLSLKKRFEWYLTTAKSAVYVNRVDLVYANLILASQFDFSELGKSRVIGYLGVAGHHLIQTGQYAMAQSAYRCAINHLKNPKESLSLVISLAISHVQLTNHNAAKKYFLVAAELARKNANTDMEAVALNSIGVMLLSDKQYLEAQTYFKRAMELHQSAGNISNHILTGENLLLSFLLSNDLAMFERLYPRIKRFMVHEDDKDKNTYLNFIHAAFLYVKTGQIDESEKEQLQNQLNSVKSQLIVQPIEKYLLPVLDMENEQLVSKSAEDETQNNPRSYEWFEESVPCEEVDNSDEATLRLLSSHDDSK